MQYLPALLKTVRASAIAFTVTQLLTTSVFASGHLAAGSWQFCSENEHSPSYSNTQNIDIDRPSGDRINLSADILSAGPDELILNGNVKVSRANDSLRADQVIVNKATNTLEAKGNLVHQQNLIQTRANSAKLDQKSDAGTFLNAEVFNDENHSTVQADEVTQINKNERLLKNISYTTCQPETPYWQIRAKNLTLNQETGRGLARNTQLRLFGVPIMYLPILSFPIDDRRASGFLYPSFANSNLSGSEISVPWYWNIAPQADATFTGRSMSQRGFQLNSEWRRITESTSTLFHTEYIDDREFGDERTFYHLKFTGEINSHWRTALTSYQLQDPEHLNDLESSFDTSDNYLKRTASLTSKGLPWQMTLLVQDYEFADKNANSTDEPFELMPRLIASRRADFRNGITGSFLTEHTDFAHKVRTDTGIRWANEASIEKFWGNSAWYVKPKINARHTQYDNDDGSKNTFSIAATSIDSGLFFDRYTSSIKQTLEPRLFILSAPYKDQSDLPNFDSSVATESYSQIFKPNRFIGKDRFGDSQSATLGLTSRVSSLASGREILRLRGAQRFNFKDRRVGESGTINDDDKTSNLYAELDWYVTPKWHVSQDLTWQDSQNGTRDSRFSLQYRADNDHLLNLSYRYDDDLIEQIDANGRWRVNNNWAVFGKYLYDNRNRQNIHRFGGVEYENCCLAFRVVKQTLLENGIEEQALYLQLSLKGLSTAGTLKPTIKDGISGYTDTFE